MEFSKHIILGMDLHMRTVGTAVRLRAEYLPYVLLTYTAI